MDYKFIALILYLLVIIKDSNARYPVILIPGDGGSQLEAKYIESPPHYICGFKNRWFLLWLNVYLMLPVTLDCFVKSITLEFDPKSNHSFSPPFCEVRSPKFGYVESLEYLSSIKLRSTSYFYYVIDDLVKKHGYTLNKDLRGAPYDFRYSPDKKNLFGVNLKRLIIDTYEENGNKPVVLLAHSLGNLYTVRLLNALDDAFKKKYIKSMISASGPYGGAVDAARTVLSGNNEHISIIEPIKLRPSQSSWPSTYYLMPNKLMGVDQKSSMVLTSKRNYTISRFREMMKDSKIKNSESLYSLSANITLPKPPKVPVYCVYTNDMPTALNLDYRKVSFPDDQPEIIYGKGDGTVNIESLKICDGWASKQSEPVKTHVIPGVSHLNIIRDDRFVQYVSEIMAAENAS